MEKKESLLNKSVININKITERVLIGSIIIHPTMLLKVIDKFKDISFLENKFNDIKGLILDIFHEKKTIENLNIRATLLNSKYKGIVIKIIDKSILLHAPFLKDKSNIDLIVEGWNEYLEGYLKKKDNIMQKTKANKLLKSLNEEDFNKFKEFNLNSKKK